MGECIFCKKYGEKSKEIFYDNGLFYAQFDIFPINPGHAEIIPVRHVSSLFDLVEKEWNVLKTTFPEVVKLVEKADLRKVYEDLVQIPVNESSKWFCRKMLHHKHLGKKPDAYNFGINEGRAAGRTVDHLHIHVIPRYLGDVLNPRGGVRHIIPGMGYY